MDEARLRETDRNIADHHKKIEEIKKKLEALRKKKAFVESKFLKEGGKLACVRLLFYSRAKGKLEELKFGRKNESIIAKDIRKGMEDSPKNLLKEYYREYYPRFDKNITLPESLVNRIIDAVVLLTQEAMQYRGMRLPTLDDFWNKVRIGSREGDWAEFDKTAEGILELFKKEQGGILEEIRTQGRLADGLERGMTALKKERSGIILAERKADAAIKNLRTEMDGAEPNKTRKHAQELLKKLLKSGYPDIRNSAEKAMEKLREEASPEHVREAETEARRLNNLYVATNGLKAKLCADIEALRPKKDYICTVAKKAGLAPGWEKDFDKLEEELKKKDGAEFCKDEFLERASQLQEEIEFFHEQIYALNRIGRRHGNIQKELGKLKETIKKILEDRNAEGMERLVQLFRHIAKYERGIGAENLPGLMARVRALINQKEYEKIRSLISGYENDGDRRKEGEIDRLDKRIKEMKEMLGLELIPDYRIQIRFASLQNCIGPEGIQKLIKEGNFELADAHNHRRLGAWPCIYSLRFRKDVISNDKIRINFEKEDRKRLFGIKELVEMMTEKQKLLPP